MRNLSKIAFSVISTLVVTSAFARCPLGTGQDRGYDSFSRDGRSPYNAPVFHAPPPGTHSYNVPMRGSRFQPSYSYDESFSPSFSSPPSYSSYPQNPNLNYGNPPSDVHMNYPSHQPPPMRDQYQNIQTGQFYSQPPLGQPSHNPEYYSGQQGMNYPQYQMNPNQMNPNLMNPNQMNPNQMNPNISNPNIGRPNIMNEPAGMNPENR